MEPDSGSAHDSPTWPLLLPAPNTAAIVLPAPDTVLLLYCQHQTLCCYCTASTKHCAAIVLPAPDTVLLLYCRQKTLSSYCTAGTRDIVLPMYLLLKPGPAPGLSAALALTCCSYPQLEKNSHLRNIP